MDEPRLPSSPDNFPSKDTSMPQQPVQLPDQQGKDRQKEHLYRQDLERRMEQLRSLQLHTEESLINLAFILHYRPKNEIQIPLHERARTIYEYHYGGRDHPMVATRLYHLARFYNSHGAYELAESLYKQAFDIHLKQLGAIHPDTVASASELMWTYEQLGRPQQADALSHLLGQLQAQARVASRQNTTNSIARPPERSDKPKQEASNPGKEVQVSQQIMKSRRQPTTESQSLPKERENQIQLSEKPQRSPLELAEFYEQKGQYVQAEKQLLHVLDEKVARKGTDPLGLARFYITLAQFYERQRSHSQDALIYYQWAVEIFKQQLGPDHPDTKRIREKTTANLTTTQSGKKIALQPLAIKILVGVVLLAGILAIGILFLTIFASR